MAAKWVEKLKECIAANPLYFVADKIICRDCGGTGKRVPLYRITNYGNTYNRCDACLKVYR